MRLVNLSGTNIYWILTPHISCGYGFPLGLEVQYHSWHCRLWASCQITAIHMWCMPESFKERFPLEWEIPNLSGACATRSFTYLLRGQSQSFESRIAITGSLQWAQDVIPLSPMQHWHMHQSGSQLPVMTRWHTRLWRNRNIAAKPYQCYGCGVLLASQICISSNLGKWNSISYGAHP